MKTSKVYFVDARAREYKYILSLPAKLSLLLDTYDLSRIIKKKDKVAIKLHFGSRGCFRTIRPTFIRQVVERVRQLGGKPFITDTGNLDKLEIAIKNGINYSACNAPIVLADGIDGKECVIVSTGEDFLKEIGVASAIYDADAMILLSHVKGHIQAGFGATLKNIAMGAVSSADHQGNVQRGKMHNLGTASFEWNSELCILCEQCIDACYFDCIRRVDDTIVIDYAKCWRCGRCRRVCPSGALGEDMSEDDFGRAMAAGAKAALSTFAPGKIACFNFILDYQPECDCMPAADVPVLPDIGILASDDPVAIDTATLDLLGKVKPLPHSQAEELGILEADPDIVRKLSGRDPLPVIRYAEQFELGTRKYELIELKPSSK